MTTAGLSTPEQPILQEAQKQPKRESLSVRISGIYQKAKEQAGGIVSAFGKIKPGEIDISEESTIIEKGQGELDQLLAEYQSDTAQTSFVQTETSAPTKPAPDTAEKESEESIQNQLSDIDTETDNNSEEERSDSGVVERWRRKIKRNRSCSRGIPKALTEQTEFHRQRRGTRHSLGKGRCRRVRWFRRQHCAQVWRKCPGFLAQQVAGRGRAEFAE